MTLERFNTIGKTERDFVARALRFPLSGYLGGENRAGHYITLLEEMWREKFGCTHAIAVNSATSGLLAACHAIGVENHSVVVSPYTMSATAAAPKFMGAGIEFADIDANYCLDPEQARLHFMGFHDPIAIIATNLFGHPAQLSQLKKLAHAKGAFLIEDNAQSPFAMEDFAYAGTVGDIGVFSLNVHKHLQCGEGGIVVTDNDEFADSIRGFINHGEMAGGPIGLNLRMTEVTAAIACAQMTRAREIVDGRVDLAKRLIQGLRDNPLVSITPTRDGCENVFYVLPMEMGPGVNREWLVSELRRYDVPLVQGYVAPLYWLPAFREPDLLASVCPVTERLHKESLAYFEICAYEPGPGEVQEIIDAFWRVADAHARLETVKAAEE